MLDQGNNYWWVLGMAGFLWLIVIGFLVTGKSFGKKSGAILANRGNVVASCSYVTGAEL